MDKKPEILAWSLWAAFDAFASNEALNAEGQSYTYQKLSSASRAIAACILLHDQGKGPVAILGRKRFYTYAGICGSLFASRAYMPLNLRFPMARNLKMLELSGAKTIVADENAAVMLEQLAEKITGHVTVIFEGNPAPWAEKYPEWDWVNPFAYNTSLTSPEIVSHPEDNAYLLYTSGTTGVPKGVPVSNQNVMAYLDHMLGAWHFFENDRFSHTFDLTFDLSVHDMMVCWLSGACLCVPDDDSALKMPAYIREKKISVWFSVPSAGIMMDRMRLLRAGWLEGIRISFFCGEALPRSVAQKWKEASQGRVVNLYGPSEATIAISAYEPGPDPKSKNGILSIGKVFASQEYCLLDPGSSETTVKRGELCLGGTQVIRGYLNDPGLNQKYFISPEEHEGKTFYRTGDLVEEDEEGDLYFLGRTDSEVKIGGFRVNLLEIDALVRELNSTEQVATILDDTGTPRLVTFTERTGCMDEAGIINLCRKELPWYMTPEVIIFVKQMPLNANGKIDRNELKRMLHG